MKTFWVLGNPSLMHFLHFWVMAQKSFVSLITFMHFWGHVKVGFYIKDIVLSKTIFDAQQKMQEKCVCWERERERAWKIRICIWKLFCQIRYIHGRIETYSLTYIFSFFCILISQNCGMSREKLSSFLYPEVWHQMRSMPLNDLNFLFWSA